MSIEKHWIVDKHDEYDGSVIVRAGDNESDGDNINLTMSPEESTHFPVTTKVTVLFEVQK